MYSYIFVFIFGTLIGYYIQPTTPTSEKNNDKTLKKMKIPKINKIDELIEILLFLDENHDKISNVHRDDSKTIAIYEEELMKKLISLDSIMIPHLRIFRKACIQQIQELQTILDFNNELDFEEE